MKQLENILSKPERILLLSPDPWKNCTVSKHHYAKLLAEKGHDVCFLEPSPDKEKYLCKVAPRLSVLHIPTFYRGLGRMPRWLALRCMREEWKRLQKLAERQFTLLWSFDTSRLFLPEALSKVCTILQIMDLTENFQLPAAAKGADLCLGGSQAICQALKAHNPQSFYIGHGYAPSGAALLPLDAKELRLRISSFKHSAGYVGNLDIPYLNWPLILRIVHNHPDTGFFFIGPYGKHSVSSSYITQLKKCRNTFFLGQKSSSVLQSYLKHFDVLLLTYRSQEYRAQLSNPHKILEYLGAGKVVLATWTEDYANTNGLIEMAEHTENFSEKLTDILANKSYYNHPKRQLERIAYAQARSYESLLLHVQNLLHGKKRVALRKSA